MADESATTGDTRLEAVSDISQPPITSQQTPLNKKTAGHSAYAASTETTNMEDRYESIAHETRGRHLVGISASDFMSKFMPWNESTPESYRTKKPSAKRIADLKSVKPKKGEVEKDMYARYRDAFEGWPDKQTPMTTFGEFQKPDPNCGGAAVDMGHYEVDDLPANGGTAHDRMQTQVEFKKHSSLDPYVDCKTSASGERVEDDEEVGDDAVAPDVIPDEERAEEQAEQADTPLAETVFPGERSSAVGRKARGQISAYAAMSMSLMFRGHLFTVVVVGGYARLIRWDRRGSIVTNRFKYTEASGVQVLFEFYLRFAQLTRAQRGFDPTVTPVANDDPHAKLARAKFSLYHSDMLHCEATAVRQDVAPVSERLFWVTITVDDITRRFIIPAPKFHWGCLSPFSRSTRRSLAYDPSKDTDRLVNPPPPPTRSGLFFMKDYWREPSTRTKPEADIYHLLAKHNVPNVAEMEVGGDISGMITRTQEDEFLQSAHKLPNGRKYHHLTLPLQCHRIFLRTIARDLTAFGNCKTLLICIADAMEAAQAAFSLARILHRDISVGNIMITSKDRGVLIDWDLCLVLDSNVVTHRPGRTGTWQFVSVHLLNGRLSPGIDAGKQSVTHSVVDDRESAFWVLLYVALLHLPHKCAPTDLYEKLSRWFDAYSVDDYNRDIGGEEKLNCLKGWAGNVLPAVQFGIPGLNALFKELAQVFMYRYSDLENADPEAESFQKNMYLAMAEKFGPDSKEVLSTHYGQYLVGGQRMGSESWLYDTLRRYARDMPTPAQPAAVPDPQRSACCAVPVMYDFVVNEFHPSIFATPTKKRSKFREARMSVTRLHGLGGHYVSSSASNSLFSTPASQGSNRLPMNLDDLDEGEAQEDDEEEPRKKKIKTGN